MQAQDTPRSLVQCAHCRAVYDLGKVEVLGRYTDCSVWRSPCCNVLVDDRGDTGWKLFKDYEHVDARRVFVDPSGRLIGRFPR